MTKNIKILNTSSEMSNLIGMYAFLFIDGKIKSKILIIGKANNTYYICQFISAISSDLNIAKLFTIEELKNWIIIPNQKIANEVLEDYYKNGFRYDVSFLEKEVTND